MADFSRLAANWADWSHRAQRTGVDVSTNGDGEVFLTSDDYSVHLREDGPWWVVDTIDDRGQRHDNTAKLSTFDLAEKYLIWSWGNSVRSMIGAERLGPRYYSLGMSPDVEVIPVSEGIAEIRSGVGSAVLMEPYATIFSHLMSKSVEEIEQMVHEGIT